MFQKRIILYILFILFNLDTDAQMLERIHSPKKASIMSAILPGFGQYYNQKYWKIPIVYISIGTAYYIAKWNQNEYQNFRTAYEYRTDEIEETIDQYENQYSESNLTTIKNYHRKNRDLAYIITVGLYALNIIDASVDAHLFNFNVNEDLSFRLQYKNINDLSFTPPMLGITLNLN